MIQLALMTSGGPIGIIGINHENMLRMQAGHPLDIDIKRITPPNTRINRLVVHYAHTYQDVVADMVKEGLPVNDKLMQEAKDMDALLQVERLAKARRSAR